LTPGQCRHRGEQIQRTVARAPPGRLQGRQRSPERPSHAAVFAAHAFICQPTGPNSSGADELLQWTDHGTLMQDRAYGGL